MTSQPEPGQLWPDNFGEGRPAQTGQVASQPWQSQTGQVVSQPRQPEPYRPDSYQPEPPYQPDKGQRGPEAPQPAPGLDGRRVYGRALRRRDFVAREQRRRRAGARSVAFGFLLSAGLLGLAVAAVGIAHQLLPRQFTPSQQRAISNWEMERRWLSLPAGKIFPAAVPYAVPGAAFGTSGDLDLHATLLGIKQDKTCAQAISGASAARIFTKHGCSAALRATYVDETGSMVATIAIAVLPDPADANAVVSQLTSSAGPVASGGASSGPLVRALRVARTPAASFGDRQRQLSQALGAGPYVILSSAGFSDGRPRVHLGTDSYLHEEMLSLMAGLVESAGKVLGTKPAAPACPGAPGC